MSYEDVKGQIHRRRLRRLAMDYLGAGLDRHDLVCEMSGDFQGIPRRPRFRTIRITSHLRGRPGKTLRDY